MDFKLGDRQREFQQAALHFAQQELLAVAKDCERTGEAKIRKAN